jgi:superfamily II DNA/RNA helicase
MPEKKQAPSWRPPSKRTSYQDSKKRHGSKPSGEGSERSERGERSERFDRAPRQDRAPRKDYAPRGERPARDDRAPRTDRNDRPARHDRGQSQERPSREGGYDRAPRSDRPSREGGYDRAPRSDRPSREGGYDRAPRSDRPSREGGYDRAPRTDRNDRGQSQERPSRDGGYDRAPRHSSGERSSRPDRAPRHGSSDRSQSYGSKDRYDSRDSRDAQRPQRSAGSRPPQSRGDYPSQQPRGARPQVVHDALEAISVTADSAEGIQFGDLGLGERIVDAIAEQGAKTPFALQAATIPVALEGRHVLGRGRTGSGKTIAFAAPTVERLLRLSSKGVKRAIGRAPRALILAPTRELALQIDRTVQPIARSVGLFTTQIYGGVPLGRQIGALERGVDIVIGTPGRIEDLMARGKLDVSQVVISVVDEADHMSELGFIEPLQRILSATSPDGQRLLFSATLDRGVSAIVQEFLPNPAVFEVAGENQETSTIDHRVYVVDQRDKRDMVVALARISGKTLMFTRTRAFAEELADHLDDYGIPAVSLHGDLNQARRQRNLDKLTSGRVNVLVATDVAARGIHVDDIETVIQVDAPDDFKSYVHRSGRTGRAGKEGVVITLTTKPRTRRLVDLLKQAGIVATPEDMKPSKVADPALV